MGKRGPKKGSPPTGIQPAVFDKTQFEASCQCWCTLDEICSIFGTTNKTLEKWVLREYGETLRSVYDKKSREGIRSIRRAQLKAALDGNPAMLIWLGKQKLGQLDKHNLEHTGKDGKPIETQSRVVVYLPDNGRDKK